jgi:hypothetical protein
MTSTPPNISDIAVFRKLAAVADELDKLASEGASLIGNAALTTAAMTVRGMAKAVYEQIMAEQGPLDS